MRHLSLPANRELASTVGPLCDQETKALRAELTSSPQLRWMSSGSSQQANFVSVTHPRSQDCDAAGASAGSQRSPVTVCSFTLGGLSRFPRVTDLVEGLSRELQGYRVNS